MYALKCDELKLEQHKLAVGDRLSADVTQRMQNYLEKIKILEHWGLYICSLIVIHLIKFSLLVLSFQSFLWLESVYVFHCYHQQGCSWLILGSLRTIRQTKLNILVWKKNQTEPYIIDPVVSITKYCCSSSFCNM